MATPPHKSLRVLFVDDEKHLQEFFGARAKRNGSARMQTDCLALADSGAGVPGQELPPPVQPMPL